MSLADRDGTAPVHIAAARGHVDVMKFLHENGVNLEVTGCIYLESASGPSLSTGVTPLMIAKKLMTAGRGSKELVHFLESVSPAPAHSAKRERSAMPMHERAALLGVTNRLKSIPPSLYTRIESGSDAERAAAKKELHSLQKANQQTVSRAEHSLG